MPPLLAESVLVTIPECNEERIVLVLHDPLGALVGYKIRWQTVGIDFLMFLTPINLSL